MTNLENNKLIAEFMGKKVISEAEFLALEFEEMTINDLFIESTLKYDTDWNWLVAVVEKIQLSKYTDEFDIFWDSIDKINGCTILPSFKNTFSIIQFTSSNKKEAVYNSCVEFIKWYNINNK